MIHSGLVIRRGSVDDIETLSAIDVDAAVLFARANLCRTRSPEFASAERDRWIDCLQTGTILVAVDPSDGDVGFAALGTVGGEPYLVQLSVRFSAMRRGIGTKLLNAVSSNIKAAGGHSLWLITYNHLAWNRPFYERSGFVLVPPDRCSPDMVNELMYQRRWLPMPEERVVMRKELTVESM